MRRAAALCERGDAAAALVCLNKAVEHGGDACDCYLRLADVHMAAGRVEEAVRVARLAVDVDSRRVIAREALALLLTVAMDYPAVQAQCRAIIALAPRNLTAYEMLLQSLLAQGRTRSALAVATRMVRIEPHAPLLRLRRASVCMEMCRTAQAYEDLEVAMSHCEDPELQAAIESYQRHVDDYHMECVEALATDDAHFRADLARDPLAAVERRRLPFSPEGRHRLLHYCMDRLPHLPAAPSGSRYH